jgi:uncharacterized protein YwgA
MNRPKYNVIELLRKLGSHSDVPGKKKFQKLVYMVENIANVRLGFDYEMYFYGPYSSKLDGLLTDLEGEGLIHYDYKGLNHLIQIDEPNEYSDFFEVDLSADELKKIEDIFSDYGSKTPNELELLTTTHFAFQNLHDKSSASVIKGVKKIKGSKYSDDNIQQALVELRLNVS